MDQTIDRIREQARRIEASGVLGRSRSYARLLAFLVECTAEGRAPKEFEIGTEVFGKGADFDPSQDSMVRVYAHHLRQKLQQYYADAGRDAPERIEIPRGEYRVALVAAADTAAADAAPTPDGPRRRRLAAAAAAAGIALLALGIVIGFSLGGPDSSPSRSWQVAAGMPLWNGLLDDELPVLVVVGDYYIFGERGERGGVERLVREYAINSSEDLDDFLMHNPNARNRFLDLDLTYLARGTAFAMRDVLRVLFTSDKPVRIVSMSELNVADMKTNHVVYLGYLSGLDKLSDLVFASSGLSIGSTYDELVNDETGTIYWSEAGMPANSRNYRDYALLSSFPGPGRNEFVIVAGTFDAGLMQSAQAATDPDVLRAAERTLAGLQDGVPPAYELLYEVTGYDRTNLDAMLVYHGALDYREIWGGEPLVAAP